MLACTPLILLLKYPSRTTRRQVTTEASRTWSQNNIRGITRATNTLETSVSGQISEALEVCRSGLRDYQDVILAF